MARRRPFKRTDRLNRQIRDVLAVALLRGSREELLRSVIVTDVEVTRDLSVARVFYYTMGDVSAADVAAALRRANGFLRCRVGEQVRARQVPELRFVFDESIERARRVEAILHDLELSPAEAEVASADDEVASADDEVASADDEDDGAAPEDAGGPDQVSPPEDAGEPG